MLEKIIKNSLIGLTTIFIVVFFHYLGWLKPVEGLVVNILMPVQSGFYNLSKGASGFYNDWLTKKNLLGENEYLKAQLVAQAIESSKLKGLEEENALLKKELNFFEQNKYKYVAAKIVSGVSDPLSQSVIINRGSKDGIYKGLAVIAADGIFIGKVIEAGDDYAKVLLISDNKSRVAATVQNIDHTVGLIEGQYGLSFSMTNIPQNQEIKEGDSIVTSGLEGQIPKNLLIAKVDRVIIVESEIFKTAILSPIIPLNSLSDVAVIVP